MRHRWGHPFHGMRASLMPPGHLTEQKILHFNGALPAINERAEPAACGR